MNIEKKKEKSYLAHFILPSFFGVVAFLVPFTYQGRRRTFVIHLSSLLYDSLQTYWPALMAGLLVLAALLTCWITLWQPAWIKKYPWLVAVGTTTPLWLCIRCIGAFLGLVAFIGWGKEFFPASLYNQQEGVLFDLLPVLLANLLCGLLFSPLLIDFGLLEFVGVPMNRVMRPLFQLPGKAAIDCLASWVGDGTIGTIISLQAYEKGDYTAKEASTVITGFSAVSITFCTVLLGRLQLTDYFGSFYFTVVMSGLVAAIVIPRIPPLSWIKEVYINGKSQKSSEQPTNQTHTWRKGLSVALQKAKKNGSLIYYCQKVAISWLELIISTLPSVMAIATVSFLLIELPYIKVLLQFVGKPFAFLLHWADIPGAERASETLFVGFFDMLIPSTMINTLQGHEYEITRFIIGALSVVQLIYISELGPILLGSKLKLTFKTLFLVFLIRTLITLPVIVGCAKIAFSYA
ncbi:MAG: YjiH family protein [Bacteroidota bacterium]